MSGWTVYIDVPPTPKIWGGGVPLYPGGLDPWLQANKINLIARLQLNSLKGETQNTKMEVS